jgi:hypothetical protein
MDMIITYSLKIWDAKTGSKSGRSFSKKESNEYPTRREAEDEIFATASFQTTHRNKGLEPHM